MRFCVRNFFIITTLLVLVSCINEEVCEDVAVLPVRIGFYQLDTVATIPPRLTLSSLSIRGIGAQGPILDNAANIAQINIPLNSITDSCAFVIRLPDVAGNTTNFNDTLWFSYTRQPVLISMDCGFVTFYNIQRVRHTNNIIDSLVVEDSNVRNTLNEHIKIFPVSAAAGL
jgi:hypothetical protein